MIVFHKTILILITLGFVVLLQTSATNAQFDLGGLTTGGRQSFSIELIPEFPKPRESTTARITGFSFDMDRARISWVHNGKVAQEGLGLLRYNFITGNLGKKEVLKVIAIANGGQRYETSLSFVIADVDILWYADTSVPPWYTGKALTSPRSNTTLTAFPYLISAGRKIPASQLIYRWSLDDDFKQIASGAGKQNFTFRTSVSNAIEHEVKLNISNLAGTITAQKTILIPVRSPKILFYEEHPLEGPRTHAALDTFNPFTIMAGEKKDFRAVPFFFTQANGLRLLDYEWTVNGEAAEKIGLPHILSLTAASGARGIASVEILIQNTINILQRLKSSFRVNVQ